MKNIVTSKRGESVCLFVYLYLFTRGIFSHSVFDVFISIPCPSLAGQIGISSLTQSRALINLIFCKITSWDTPKFYHVYRVYASNMFPCHPYPNIYVHMFKKAGKIHGPTCPTHCVKNAICSWQDNRCRLD